MGALLKQLGIRESEFDVSFVRSSGAGGQNVNKVNSKAILRWRPAESACIRRPVIERFLQRFANKLTASGELIIASERHRDQPRNLADCIVKLEDMLRTVLEAPRTRKQTKPTTAAREKRLDTKKARSARKQHRQKIRGF